MRRCLIMMGVLGLAALPACFSDKGGTGEGDGDEEAGTEDGTDDTNGSGEESGEGDGSSDTGSSSDTTDSDTTDSDTTDTGATPCGEGHVCVPDPGGDWQGPVSVGGDGCSGDFPDEVAELFTGLEAGDASCECTCGQPSVTCSKNMSVVGYSQINCVGPQGAHNLSENQCYSTFGGSHEVTLAKASSSCATGSVTENIPDPSWADSAFACDGFTAGEGDCDDASDTCVPNPSAGDICYWQDGDHECPDGFGTKTLYYTGVDDTRACPGTCSCSATEPICKVSITGFANSNCTSGQGAKTAFSGGGVCAASNSQVVKSIRPGTVVVDDAGSCTPGNANLNGEVEGTGATTVCCM